MKRKKVRRGVRMKIGSGWVLRKTRRDSIQNVFKGTLLTTFNFGNKRIAVFSVPK